jgi:hypothetical protein
MSEFEEKFRNPRPTGSATKEELRRIDKLNVLFKLHDIDAIVRFEEPKEGNFRKGKPIVISRHVGAGDHRGEKRYRRIKDAEQAAVRMFNASQAEEFVSAYSR